MDYDNTNRGVLFKATDKKEETHADYQGSVNVGGVEYFLNGWKKKSTKGVDYLSLSVKPKTARAAENAPRAREPGDDDSEPF